VNRDRIDDYLDQMSTPEERAAFEKDMVASPALAEEMILFSLDRVLLGEVVREKALKRAASTQSAPAARGRVPARPDMGAAGRRGARRALGWLAAAACVAAAIGMAAALLSATKKPPAPQAIAEIAGSSGDVRLVRASGEPAADAKIYSGDAVTAAGASSRANIRLTDGTRIDLGPDSRLKLAEDEKGKSYALDSGAVSAEVVPQLPGKPLIFTTPHARAEVVGTRLTLAVTTQWTRLEVEEGKVELRRTQDGKAAVVGMGQFALAGPEFAPEAQAIMKAAAVEPADQRLLKALLKRTEDLPAEFTSEFCRQALEKDAQEFAWLTGSRMEMCLTAYRLTVDEKYLDVFVRVFGSLRALLTRDTQGFLGWYGAPTQEGDDPSRKVDYQITDFWAVSQLADFISITGADVRLKEKYARQRAEYLDLAENNFVKKWDARGCHEDLGEIGGVYRVPNDMALKRAGITLAHHQQGIIARGFLALYGVTRNDAYAKRAAKLGVRFKRCLTLKDGHYEWNTWDPAGAWDASHSDPAEWKHPYNPPNEDRFFTSAVEFAAALYHYGLVFDRTDMERFVRSQSGFQPLPGVKAYRASVLAAFDDSLARSFYSPERRNEIEQTAEKGWEGGVAAGAWLEGKYGYLVRAAGGRQIYLDRGGWFLARPEGRALMDSLRFEVTGAGYQAPATPGGQ
jgi:hypothetical protein